MGLHTQRAALDDVGKVEEVKHEFAFLFGIQQSQVYVANVERAAFRPGEFRDARNPRVGVLDVINGVLVRLFTGKCQVKIEWGVGSPHKKKIFCHVASDVVYELSHRDKLAGPLAHAHRFPVLLQAHPTYEYYVQPVFLGTENGHRGFHSRNVSVVIRSEQIDRPRESPA